MKKILCILVMCFVTIGAFAQNLKKERIDYARYGFWSNWSIGINAIATEQFNDANTWSFGQGTNVGAGLMFTKQLNPKWLFRINLDVPGIVSIDSLNYDRYGLFTVGFNYYFVKGFYGTINGGVAYRWDNKFDNFTYDVNAGLGYNWLIGNHSNIFIEGGANTIAFIDNDNRNLSIYLRLGYRYDFGLTKNDQKLKDQMLVIYDENVYVLKTKYDSIDDVKTNLEKNEKDLIKRIESLENTNYLMGNEILVKDSIIESLDSIIFNMRENQGNFYALPFSVLFDFDSYAINESEMNKIKAVASIMKDDTTVNYTLTGFCDNTGSKEYNQKLSEKRVNAVKKALLKYGVKEDQIDVNAKGLEAPFSDGKLTVNRRVSFYRNF